MRHRLILAFAIVVPTMAVVVQGAVQDHNVTDGHSVLAQAEHGHRHDGPPMKVEFENDSVQVMRIVVPPHAKIPMHDVTTPRVVILLTDEDLRITRPDGTTQDIHQKAGEINWMEPQKHAGENLSDKPLEFIVVVPKKS